MIELDEDEATVAAACVQKELNKGFSGYRGRDGSYVGLTALRDKLLGVLASEES